MTFLQICTFAVLYKAYLAARRGKRSRAATAHYEVHLLENIVNLIYMSGYLNPDIIAIEVDGQTVNLMTAANLALLTAYALYAKDVFLKLKDMILSKTSGKPPDDLLENLEGLEAPVALEAPEDEEPPATDTGSE